LGRNAPASTSAAIVFPVPLSPEKSALMPKPRFILRSKRHFDCRGKASQTGGDLASILKIFFLGENSVGEASLGEFPRLLTLIHMVP
jgi:hypothetical protein